MSELCSTSCAKGACYVPQDFPMREVGVLVFALISCTVFCTNVQIFCEMARNGMVVSHMSADISMAICQHWQYFLTLTKPINQLFRGELQFNFAVSTTPVSW